MSGIWAMRWVLLNSPTALGTRQGSLPMLGGMLDDKALKPSS